MGEDAFHGIVGETVRAIEPYTEADPAALLVQYLVTFGNIVGPGPHFIADGSRHGLNLFAVLVGATSKARKGTSWGHIHTLAKSVDNEWSENCIQTGLSSGEGLIYAVRDSRGDDPGVFDKRVLVIEEEFASTLRVLERDGNTLSPTIRLAWDGKQLQILTKQSPCKATGTHISFIGHITKDELRRGLTSTDMANGFANRKLWVCVRRSKALPDGGRVPEARLKQLQRKLAAAVSHARSLNVCELKRDADANEFWHMIYPDLSEGKPGLFGAVTSRAEAQVMRLACLYALLDCSLLIRPEHLFAAIAVWNYCEASARFIFGDSLGDPLADELLQMLRQNPAGLTRTDLSNALGRNRARTEIGRALTVLVENGLATSKLERTEGRPAERWFAV
jgi:hypothetical protein